MPDIYKHGYDNFKKITVLFILQIILGVLPVVLLVIYIRLFTVFKCCTGLYVHSYNGYSGGTEFLYNKTL